MRDKSELISYENILEAQQIIKNRLHRTPLVGSSYLGDLTGVKLYFKLELFQKTGSFKPRGVLNKLHNLDDKEKQKGVISLSAGNHAQSLAWAASQSNIKSTIVMPDAAPESKVKATIAYGGKVIPAKGNLLETCLAIQREQDLTMVHPFDDPLIIAGQGTIGVEIMEDLPDVDVVIAGIGGGGLISGISSAIKAKRPEVKIIGVEPEGASAMTQSLIKGEPVHLETTDTIADGLAAPFAGHHTLAHVKEHVDQVVTVSDKEILTAMRLIFERCKVTAEPAAASTLAALLSDRIKPPKDAKVVCVLSGGNIDMTKLKTLM